jgi:hypothetical protein
MPAMRNGHSALMALLLLGTFAITTGCEKEPPASKKACFEAIDKGRQMLSVPDHPAAKDWLARAKKECLEDQAAAIAGLEKEIAASEALAAEKAKKREESFKPKPANESLAPGFVEAATKYRDTKKREVCEADPCADVEAAGKLTVRRSTAKGKRDAFRVFARIGGERIGCDQLGPSEVKRRWESETQIKVHCALTNGSLKGLFALLEQEKERPETHVIVFSEKWIERDAELKAQLEGTGAPGPSKSAP